MKKLLIIGGGEQAEIVFEYFSRDTDFSVVGFAVNREYLKQDKLLGLPVVPFEACENLFPPSSHYAHVAVLNSRLNRDRARLFAETKEKGYVFARYVSPRAFVDTDATIGENVFIFEHNVVQRGCAIGDNAILWSGNHIGHRTMVGAHVFISSHVVVSGFCRIGDYCYFGVNSAVGDHVQIGDDCTVGAGVVVIKDMPDNAVAQTPPVKIIENLSRRFWRVK